MTFQINIAEAKARLSELIDRAERGEDIVLARAGKPVARIVVDQAGASRASFFGVLAHLGPVPDEAWSPEAADAVYGFEDDASPMLEVASPPDRQFRHRD